MTVLRQAQHERRLRLRPAPGRRVRHRDGRLFDPAGERVPTTPFYARLLAAGDIEPVLGIKSRKSKSVPKSSERTSP